MTSPQHRVRVLHIVSRLAYYGAENFVRELAQTLNGRFVDTAVLTFYESPIDATSNLSYPELAIRRKGRFELAFLPRTIRAIREWKPDIVHTHVHNGKYWGRITALAAGVRCIIHTEHNSDFSAPLAARLVNRMLHSLTSAVVAFTPAHARALSQAEHLPASRISIIPNGISRQVASIEERKQARAELGLDDRTLLVMHVGRLTAVKNQRLALQVFARTLDSLPSAQIAFVGDGADERALRALATQLGIDRAVSFLGFRRDVRALLPGADALLVTSTNEAMPIAVLEAFFAGVPVVSTPWNGSQDIFADDRYGLVSADWSVDGLAQALRRTFVEKESSVTRVHSARRFACDNYDITQTAARYAQLYERCLQKCRNQIEGCARIIET